MTRSLELRRLLKRGFDIAASAAGLVASAPLLGATALAVRASMGAPVLFRHQRPGLNGKPFALYKFRTMKEARDKEGSLLPDHARLTRVGRVVRSFSLDELPQLLNVLKGDMSLVGPRPLLLQYLPRYSPEQARRHAVRPGITGWAQVNGRNALSWNEKLSYDVWYVNNWSLLLDVQILARTLGQVLRRDGISSVGHVTMPEFMGNEHE